MGKGVRHKLECAGRVALRLRSWCSLGYAEPCLDEDEDEDEEGSMRLWRRKKRFRSISDLYKSTEPLIVANETERKRRRRTSRSAQKN
ncbi:hypothetical protein ACE6H2_001892 [Prunus campanulata]